MTCIAGIRDASGRILMGADSAGVADWGMRIRADRKIFVRDGMIFGFTTSFRMGQLLQYKLEVPKQPVGMSDYEYLVASFVERVRSCLRAGGCSETENEVEKGGDFLLGYRRNLYHICSDFQVGLREDGYDAVGSGADIALGALFATREDSNSEKRINLSLEAAAHLNAGVRAPFHVLALEPSVARKGRKASGGRS